MLEEALSLISIKMRKDLMREIEIPDGVTVKKTNDEVSVSGSGKELKREFDFGKVKMEVKDKKVVLKAEKATRRESRMIGTIWAHLKNMIKGISEEFVYELEICNVHFPMNVKVEGSEVVIKSFLGEKTDRFAKILPNVKVDISGSKITVTSNDIEAAGLTATNLEKAARLTGRDRRIFQDGIFITSKNGRTI